MALNLATLLSQPLQKPTVIVDTRRCRYSSELVKELQRTDINEAVAILDIGTLSLDTVQSVDWLVGVPCLLHEDKAFLGVDAFSKSREVARSALLGHHDTSTTDP